MSHTASILTICQYIKTTINIDIYRIQISILCLGTHFENIFSISKTAWAAVNLLLCWSAGAKCWYRQTLGRKDDARAYGST